MKFVKSTQRVFVEKTKKSWEMQWLDLGLWKKPMNSHFETFMKLGLCRIHVWISWGFIQPFGHNQGGSALLEGGSYVDAILAKPAIPHSWAFVVKACWCSDTSQDFEGRSIHGTLSRFRAKGCSLEKHIWSILCGVDFLYLWTCS